MVEERPGAIALAEAIRFVGHLSTGAAIVDPENDLPLHVNEVLQRRAQLDPTAPLPEAWPIFKVGVHRWMTDAGPLTLTVSALPIVEYPRALLVQGFEASTGASIGDAVKADFPIGVAWINRQTDGVDLVNPGFWDAWHLPRRRHPDRGHALQKTCRGHVLDTTQFDLAWPATDTAPGRFQDVSLTDGRTLRLAAFDLPTGYRWVLVEDVTEAKENRLAEWANALRSQESQRLESLTALAGGIAHDFNNLLLVILANAELLREDPEVGAQGQLALSDIRVAAERASELSASMLAFSGRGHMANVQTSVCDLLREVVDEIDGEYIANVSIRVSCQGPGPLVTGDPAQLKQLFKALMRNAQESVGVSAIQVMCSYDTWSTERLSGLYLGEQLVSGPYVSATVEDDGEGIEAAVLNRIFDPFFSSRGPSRGLGLAAAAGIARGHGGTIHVDSTRGQGASVQVLLPLVVHPTPRRPSTPSVHRPRPHSGTVLLVDDESLVRRSARRALEQAGFQVVEAEHGAQAIELFGNQPDRFDLVIMDISMPGVPGDIVAHEIRTMTDQPVPLVLSSGYRPKIELGPTGVADRFLEKPYRQAELVQTARELLEKDG